MKYNEIYKCSFKDFKMCEKYLKSIGFSWHKKSVQKLIYDQVNNIKTGYIYFHIVNNIMYWSTRNESLDTNIKIILIDRKLKIKKLI